MALKYCVCPLDVIPDLGNQVCPEIHGQYIKLAFQKPQDTPYFPSIGDLQTEGNWTTALGAADDTKIQIVSLSRGLVIPSSEGDFDTDETNFNGLQNYLGENNVVITGLIKNVDVTTYKALQELSCFGKPDFGESELTAFFFTNTQKIVHDTDEDTNTIPDGIPIYNFRISSPGNDGTKNADQNFEISLELDGDWARNVIASPSPNFNPLKLQNA